MPDKIDLKLFKSRLLQQQKELLELEQTGDDAAKTVELDQTRVGRLSRMDALQGQAMSLEMKRRRQIELQKITAALRRIDEDDYGYCICCNEAIAIKRLEIDPATTHCISCAEKSETN
ncbi:TraR/DksA family transcriptional regulator [Pseudomonadota bacterium]